MVRGKEWIVMSRKPNPDAKVHDPAYITKRNREVRQRNRAQVAIRIPDEMLARWHAAAAHRELTLKEWIVETLELAVAVIEE